MRFLFYFVFVASAYAAPQDWTGVFPCDPGKLPSQPVVLLLGESHSSPFSAGVKAQVIDGGARGAFYAATEPSGEGPMTPDLARETVKKLGYPEDRSRLYGLEGGLASAFSALWLLTGESAPLSGMPRITHMMLRDDINSEPGVRQAFEAALKNGRIEDGRQRKVVRALLDGNTAAASTEDTVAFAEAAKEAREEAADALRREYDEAAVNEIMSRLNPHADTNELKTGVMAEIRDRDFALQSASHYCGAAIERKNLVVLVGYNHVAGIRSFLEKWSPSALDIREIATDNAEGAKAAAEAISSWKPATPRAPSRSLAELEDWKR